MNLDQQFENAALYLAAETAKVTNSPTRILSMIHQHGAVDATKRMLAKDISDGFVRVAALGRLDLTLEYLVATNELFQSLFTPNEVRIAKQRAGVA